MTVHVNEEDGDVNIESPTSLQVIFYFYYSIVLLLFLLFVKIIFQLVCEVFQKFHFYI